MIENPISVVSEHDKDAKARYTKEVMQDLWTCIVSREASLLGRKEVLTGKAKFGILGDGKEVPQVAMARAFKKGDYRSGYYRDQTFMFALGLMTVEQFFSQLYADTENDIFAGGRQMNGHFATRFIDDDGEWLDLMDEYNVSSDVSSTGGQMGRALGLALASKKFKSLDIKDQEKLSNNGNEVSFVTIGDASTSEGVFWETINAAAVMSVPLAVNVWDDGYGISVPKEFQTAKSSISKALDGMLIEDNDNGIYIVKITGYDYPALVSSYEKIIAKVRREHKPALIHVTDLTQPQGHSTSGSHERYKSEERLNWEKEFDCIAKMIEWVVENKIASQEEIDDMKEKATAYVKESAKNAWANFQEPFKIIKQELTQIYASIEQLNIPNVDISKRLNELKAIRSLSLGELTANARHLKFDLLKVKENFPALNAFIDKCKEIGAEKYNTELYSNTSKSALKVPYVHQEFDEEAETIPGYKILNQYFENLFERDNRFLAFGEDVGNIGDVNQGFAGLQEKFGIERIFDTGIRELTIMGQAIGLALRGFRPIAEIQYLDYLIYGLQPLTDDLATLRYRSVGMQHAPTIIRTRGHRLEGIWHAGSPLGMILNSLRGMHVCVPRNMVQAVGMYNTLVQSDEPALVIESLNGYRIRERKPSNLGTYTVPLGMPEVIIEGTDVTLVTYGSLVRIAESAVEKLIALNISVELIDVQTLLPFDLEHQIAASLSKTNRIVFLDEDVPSGGTAYMMQQVLENQNGYKLLDSKPITISAKDHRTPFGSDGDYFTKPGVEDIIEQIYSLMNEVNPDTYPKFGN